MKFIRQPWETEARLRIFALGFFLFALFLLLLARLYYLQLFHGDEHKKLVAGQSLRRVRLAGWRGSIITDDGLLLAGNRPAYDVVFYPGEMRRGGRKKSIAYMTESAAAIGNAVGRKNPPDAEAFQRHLRISPALPMVVFHDLSDRELARAYEAMSSIPGAEIQCVPVRIYPCGKLAAGIVGFARLADGNSAVDREAFFYYYSDMEGREGVEKAFDSIPGNDHSQGLRAIPGRMALQVNNVGYIHRQVEGKVEPIHGNNVRLTINSRAQKIAARLLGDLTGALVVVDADNGDIICAVDSPTFDLSAFTPRLNPEYYRQLVNDPRRPLINRSFRGIYQPGSTLKPFVSLALLNAGINPEEEIPCDGRVEIGNAGVRCQAHRYGGVTLNMYRALEKSCNSYMIQRALQVGPSVIVSMLDSAGLGRHTGLEIPDSAGDFPSADLKRRRYHADWNRYDTALLSIGQGLISVTPLQMALAVAAIANGGTVWRPHLVRSVIANDGTVWSPGVLCPVKEEPGKLLYRRVPAIAGHLEITPETLAVVRKGMELVVNSSGGSGRQAAVGGLTIYGKTGTAETGSRNNIRNITHFVAFTEYRGRRYAAVATVEDGVSGGRTCAPLIAEFFREYLRPEGSRTP